MVWLRAAFDRHDGDVAGVIVEPAMTNGGAVSARGSSVRRYWYPLAALVRRVIEERL